MGATTTRGDTCHCARSRPVTLRFDDALPVAVSVLHEQLGDQPGRITLVRDAVGTITVILPGLTIESSKWKAVAKDLHVRLQRFSPGERQVLLREADLIAPDDILSSADRVPLPDEHDVWLVDRMLTNQDWIRPPLRSKPTLPLGVAFSIKGGVGRSTALAILGWHLARSGHKVLLVDLDLEAPGLAPMLLPELPDYGLVDWCIESLVGQADSQLFAQMWRQAPVANDANGSVLVVPAYGTRTTDYVAKLGRVYMPHVSADGRATGLADRLDALLACAKGDLEPPDVVLFDSRAGIHDIGSAAVTQLGAEVFLFARDDPPTWSAYAHLFRHLRVSRSVEWGMPDHDLRWRMQMVAAQSDPTTGASDRFVDRSYSLWNGNLYDSQLDEEEEVRREGLGETPALFERDDPSAPHSALRILFDPKVRDLDFISEKARPDWLFLEATFGPFLLGAADRLASSEVA